ncbi:MAG: ribosome biogenesis factor YjgA [Pseudomonadota bacterium]
MTETKPSKTARKQAQSELQALGERLIDLERDELAALQLDESLLDALATAKRIRSHEALRRQKQYIGKLMRHVDAAPIRALFEGRERDTAKEKRLFSTAERWRDRIVREGRSAVQEFCAGNETNNDELNALLDQLNKAFSDRDEKTARRAIFRQVHETLVARNKDELGHSDG